MDRALRILSAAFLLFVIGAQGVILTEVRSMRREVEDLTNLNHAVLSDVANTPTVVRVSVPTTQRSDAQ